MKSDFADQQLSPKSLERLMSALKLARKGDFTVRMQAEGDGVEREVADTLNEFLEMLVEITKEFERVAESVSQGELRTRVPLDKASGGWGQLLRAVNNIMAVFGKHAAEMRRVIKSVHTGDLARLVPVGPETIHRGGELQRIAEDMNGMIVHIDRLTSEVTRVFAEVGLDGRLNAQCHLSDANGSWALLVGSVNAASSSLSEQVQDLCEAAQAIAQGNLAARATVTSRGDLQTLKLGLNSAAEGMLALCAELRRTAHEVTIEGKLAVVMQHPNPRGEWQATQDAFNHLLQALGASLRGATESAEHMLHGEPLDLGAQRPGELGLAAKALQRLAEQDQRTQLGIVQLTEGNFEAVYDGDSPRELAMLHLSQRLKREWFNSARVALLEARDRCPDSPSFARAALIAIARTVDAVVGAYHSRRVDGNFVRVANLGWDASANSDPVTRVGDGLVGRAAAEGEPLLLDQLDTQDVRIRASLIEIIPRSVLIFPIKNETGVVALVELGFVRGSAKTARELLEFLTADLARGARLFAPSEEAPVGREQLRALDEELVISNARLERLTHELQVRDKNVRELQQELQRANDASDPSPDASVSEVRSA